MPESVDLLEDMVVEYVVEMVHHQQTSFSTSSFTTSSHH
jgi:hypothetical protein